jgi:dihydromethanopterin reductase
VPIVRAMCAIGQRGQLGLRGRLPWEGDTRP